MNNLNIFWSPEAVEDFELIVNYIKKDSEFYSKVVAEKIFEQIEKLEDFPQIGKVVPEINSQNIREILVYNYRIIYRIESKKILILTIIHSKRDFNSVIKEKNNLK